MKLTLKGREYMHCFIHGSTGWLVTGLFGESGDFSLTGYELVQPVRSCQCVSVSMCVNRDGPSRNSDTQRHLPHRIPLHIPPMAASGCSLHFLIRWEEASKS